MIHTKTDACSPVQRLDHVKSFKLILPWAVLLIVQADWLTQGQAQEKGEGIAERINLVFPPSCPETLSTAIHIRGEVQRMFWRACEAEMRGDPEAKSLYRQACEKADSVSSPAMRMHCQAYFGHYYYLHRDYAKAGRCYDEAYHLALQVDGHPMTSVLYLLALGRGLADGNRAMTKKPVPQVLAQGILDNDEAESMYYKLIDLSHRFTHDNPKTEAASIEQLEIFAWQSLGGLFAAEKDLRRSTFVENKIKELKMISEGTTR
jgi:hypothetical protein